jgi:AcrR family transcriptional regulator
MPRRSAADARQTRTAILERSVDLASTEGLEGLTIGRVAGESHLSKAGVLGHFGTKEELQLETFAAGIAIFTDEVWVRARGAAPGRARLLAVCDAWLSYLERDVFPGGCLFTSASCEFDDRPGRVRDAVVAAHVRWLGVLEHDARAAVAAGELPRGTDPGEVAFELNALAMGVNQARRLLGDPAAARHGWRAMRRILHAPGARRRRTG